MVFVFNEGFHQVMLFLFLGIALQFMNLGQNVKWGISRYFISVKTRRVTVI